MRESFPYQSYALTIVESHCIVHDFIIPERWVSLYINLDPANLQPAVKSLLEKRLQQSSNRSTLWILTCRAQYPPPKTTAQPPKWDAMDSKWCKRAAREGKTDMRLVSAWNPRARADGWVIRAEIVGGVGADWAEREILDRGWEDKGFV